MKILYRYLKFSLRNSFVYYYARLRIKSENWVFSRTACLGNDSYSHLVQKEGRNTLRLNLQKNRIDSLNGSLKVRRIGLAGIRILDRKDLLDILWIQNLKFWRRLPAPNYILIDSYSELTDQQFVFGERRFFANYKDVRREYLQKRLILTLGLLNSNQIHLQYKLFLEEINRIWWKSQFNIYFIHFPSKFESRELFINRAIDIRIAIDELALIFPNLISIVIPEELVTQQVNARGVLDTFPYHFDAGVARYVAQEISKHEAEKRRSVT
jgi:hypothetical protein